MKYYFELQYTRTLRMIRDLGIDPYIGILIGIGQFVFISFIIFKRVAYPQYIYSFLSLLFVIPLGNTSRNAFLKSIFLKTNYFYLRLFENIIWVFPFCIYLIIRKEYLIAVATLVVSAILSLFNKINQPKIVIPSPFSRNPYEFTIGFRRTYLLFFIIFILGGISIRYDNFNLGIFSLLILFLLCCTFYSVRDPIFYVWIHAQTPKKFLLRKIKTGLSYTCWLSVVIAIPLFYVWPEKGLLIMITMLIGFLYLILIILSVFVNYPVPSTVSQKVQVVISMLFPPLLIFIIPNLYFQALRRLNVYLK